MSKFLVSVVETYRVDTEAEASKVIEEAKADATYTLSKYTNEHKERKSKGEVAEKYQKVTLTKTFNDIKDPTSYVEVIYEVE